MARERIQETPLKVMYSQVFGLDLTEEQILEGARKPKPKQADILFGPIARQWHKDHPPKPATDDDSNLLGC